MADSRLLRVIAEVLELPSEEIPADASSDTIEAWDSLGHLEIILAVEDSFNIKFHTSEIASLTSVSKLEQALRQRNAL